MICIVQKNMEIFNISYIHTIIIFILKYSPQIIAKMTLDYIDFALHNTEKTKAKNVINYLPQNKIKRIIVFSFDSVMESKVSFKNVYLLFLFI